jgi:hypothetical protein
MKKHNFPDSARSTTPCTQCGCWRDEGEDISCTPRIINTTPHACTFQGADGSVYEVPPCGILVNARTVEEKSGVGPGGVELVKTRFVADPASEQDLAALEAKNPGSIIVGSIIAAQAFPGRVLAMVPAPGFERVPPAEKRMRDDKFTVF